MILRPLLVLFTFGSLHALAGGPPPAAYEPREGDFVFQSLGHCELVDAIEGVSESPYSHVGLMVKKGGAWYVREALGTVHDTPLETWISHGRRGGAFDAYRLREPHRRHIAALVRASAGFLGRPYDFRYEMDDEKIYCSELLYKAMLAASGEKVGRVQKLGDLKWRPYAGTIEKFEGGPVPLDREMITPRALAEAPQLERVHAGYAAPASPAAAPAPTAEIMTPARFREIVALPADAAPLPPEFARLPGANWAKTRSRVISVYEDGRAFSDTALGTAKYVGGRYAVTTARLEAARSTWHTVVRYDAKTDGYTAWNLDGDHVVESTLRFDFAKKTYAVACDCTVDGVRCSETATGVFADDVRSATYLVRKNGKLEMMRSVLETPVR